MIFYSLLNTKEKIAAWIAIFGGGTAFFFFYGYVAELMR
jgi:hypothetical protein